MDRIATIAKDYVSTLTEGTRREERRTFSTLPSPAKSLRPRTTGEPAPRIPRRQQAGKRDYGAERAIACMRQTGRVAELAVARNDQSLGDESIKLAQAMIFCTLPHSPTTETKITRRARLGDGSTLAVTFSAAADGIAMPYGADRRLLFWLIDRAIRSDSPFVPWASAAEYQKEVGMEKGGRTNKQLKERFARISGLVINISRKGVDATQLETFPVISKSFLPNSIKQAHSEQESLPELGNRYGVLLHGPLFEDIKKHHSAMPRRLWLEIKGPTPVQDLAFWLFYRCYAAASESVIPWSSLSEQFLSGDSNPYRFRQHMRQAIKLLKALWPEAQLVEVPSGVWVNRATAGMLEDDPRMNRQRRL